MIWSEYLLHSMKDFSSKLPFNHIHFFRLNGVSLSCLAVSNLLSTRDLPLKLNEPPMPGTVEVPGLAEKRPSILVGDSVHLCLQRSSGQWYEGRVHVVREREVGLRFHERFAYHSGELCEVRFTVPRIPLRRMHMAVNSDFSPDRVLFPDASHIAGLRRPSDTEMSRITTFNPFIATNPPQLEAVTAIVNRPPGSVPFVIWGP